MDAEAHLRLLTAHTISTIISQDGQHIVIVPGISKPLAGSGLLQLKFYLDMQQNPHKNCCMIIRSIFEGLFPR